MKLFSNTLMVLLLSILAAVPGMAQDSESGSFTLEECIDYAMQHNANAKNERLNISIAKAQIGETVAQGLPQINGAGEINANVEIPVQFLPGSFLGTPEIEYAPVQFGVPFQGNMSISASQLLFDGSYFVGLQAAKVYRQLAEKGVRRAEIDVAEGVSLAYFGAIVAKERLDLLKTNLQRLDSLHRETQAMYQNGFAEAIDVQRIKVNLNNVRTQYENVQRSLAVNLNALKFQMGMRLDRDIQLKQRINDFSIQHEELSDDGFTYGDRVEYQELQVSRALSKLDMKNIQSQYLPRLNAVGNVGWIAGKPTFGGLFQPTQNIVDSEGRVMQAHTWNRFMAVGVRMELPIFDGLLKANRIKRARLELEQVENQFQNLENSIDLEINQAYTNLQNSRQNLAAQQENMELAQEVFRVTKIKYQQGVGSNLEVIEAENAFKEAETNYFNALYEALVARVSYQKATGTLYQK